MRGPSTVVAFSNAAPDRQLMLTAVFELSALNTSRNKPDARLLREPQLLLDAEVEHADRVLPPRADRLDQEQLRAL